MRYVTSYLERLMKLADNDSLRIQLASFPLAPDATEAVLPEHRSGTAGCPTCTRFLVLLTYNNTVSVKSVKSSTLQCTLFTLNKF